MAKGDLKVLQAMMKADPECTLAAESHDFYVAANLKAWTERRSLVGSGHCAVLVQTATGCGKTRFWVRGPRVKGNSAVPEGTAIAIFDEDGTYPSKGNHAAIYIKPVSNGLLTLDQWTHDEGKKAAIEKGGFWFVQTYGNKRYPLNDGNRFHVILTARKIVSHGEVEHGCLLQRW